MVSKSFDDIIKSKLDQFRMEAGADAFEHFEETKANAEFDQAIHSKIEPHHLEIFPKDWAELSERLDKETIVNDFDALIGAKLSSIATDDKPDWDQFEQLLDNDEAFDSEISEKVKNHTVPSSDSQWPKLSAHLEEVERRRNRIVITKFVEAAIFILFILTIMQLYPINNIGKDQTPYRNYVFQEDDEVDGRKNLSTASGELLDKNVGVSVVESQISNYSSEQSILNEVAIVGNESARISSEAFSFVAEQVSNELVKKNLVEKELIILASNLPIDLKNIAIDRNIPTVISNEKETVEILDISAPQYKSNVSNSVALTSLGIDMLEFDRERFVIPVKSINTNSDKGQYWINTYGAPDVNFISTPYDLHYRTDAYQHGSYGYTAGATISYERDNWEIESGLAYSSMNYQPLQITEVTGSGTNGITETTLKEIIMNFVEIPMNFKYKLFKNKNWSVYANSGLSVGALASAKYDIDEVNHRVFASRTPDAASSGNTEILKRKEFDPGLLNGGTVSNNIFATLNTGIGVTKKISDGVSFYAQPTYHHNLAVGGLGPNNDVHHRLSVQIGTKVRL